MSKFEEVYQEELGVNFYYWSKEVTASINKLKEAHDEDMKYERERLERNVDLCMKLIKLLNSLMLKS